MNSVRNVTRRACSCSYPALNYAFLKACRLNRYFVRWVPCDFAEAAWERTYHKMIRLLLAPGGGPFWERWQAAAAAIGFVLSRLLRGRRTLSGSNNSALPAGGVGRVRSRSSRARVRAYLVTVRQQSPSLKFGLDIKNYVSDSAILHTKLYQLLLYLYVNGSSVVHIFPLSAVDVQESKELKRMLKKRREIRMCDYGVSAATAVLKDFLKQLKTPPLEQRQWVGFAAQLSNMSSSAEMANLYERCRWEIGQLAHPIGLFLPFLVVTIRNMALDRHQKYLDTERVMMILRYLGPAILRTKGRKVRKNAVLSEPDLAVLQFIVCSSRQIFGDLQNLFPPKQKTQKRNTYSPPPGFRGPTWYTVLGKGMRQRKESLQEKLFLESLLSELKNHQNRMSGKKSDTDMS